MVSSRNTKLEPILKIAVGGFTSARTKLRISVLLNTMPEYQVTYVDSDREIAKIIDDVDLVIGAGAMAREGVLRQKSVIVVGDYGMEGLITPINFHNQINNDFKGRINGMKDEYFSLELLEREIKKSQDLTFQELKMMSNQMITFLHNIDF